MNKRLGANWELMTRQCQIYIVVNIEKQKYDPALFFTFCTS